jgi:hypothetical protein
MSDISFDLAGVIALLVFMISAGAFGLAALISVIVAIALGAGNEKGFFRTKAFGFFAAAVPLVLLDLIGFAVMFYTADSNSHRTNDLLDTVACVWFLLQPVIWIAAAIILNRIRLR